MNDLPLPVGKSSLTAHEQGELAWELFRRTPELQCAEHDGREPGTPHVWFGSGGYDRHHICIPNPVVMVCPEHPETLITTSNGRHAPRCPRAVCRYEGEGIPR